MFGPRGSPIDTLVPRAFSSLLVMKSIKIQNLLPDSTMQVQEAGNPCKMPPAKGRSTPQFRSCCNLAQVQTLPQAPHLSHDIRLAP